MKILMSREDLASVVIAPVSLVRVERTPGIVKKSTETVNSLFPISCLGKCKSVWTMDVILDNLPIIKLR